MLLAGCAKEGVSGLSPQVLANTQTQNEIKKNKGESFVCDEKMSQRYQRRLDDLDEYNDILLEILSSVENVSGYNYFEYFKSTTEIAPPSIQEIAENKKWYITYCNKTDILKSKNSMHYDTGSATFQTEQEVFIDASTYDNMSEDQKIFLVLHEIVSSYYISQYLSVRDLCKNIPSYRLCNSDEQISRQFVDYYARDAKLKKTLDFISIIENSVSTYFIQNLNPNELCDLLHAACLIFPTTSKLTEKDIFGLNKKEQLTLEDRQHIDAVTHWLLEKRDDLTPENFKFILIKNKFDPRFFSDVD